ncbi:MAG: efflux RND transporter periplasmic adaptor subunit [Elusimicrobia bacterium]|nr:efflux RND transporter periplasmic adaptor subunit [Elusimicrobiota bacterium]
MSVKKKIFYGILVLMAAILLLKIAPRFFSEGKNGKKSIEAVPVTVAEVKKVLIEEEMQLTGDVRGLNEARLYPKVPGRLLRKIKDAGDIVKKDEVVALIDRDEPGLKFKAAEVTSSLGGVLTRYFLDLGQNVNAATPVCEVAVISPIKIMVRITERDFPRVHIGMTARFTCDPYPGETFNGRVTKMSNAMDEATRSADVEIDAANPGNKLKPGMFANVSIIISSKPNALAIPRDALAATGETKYVFVVDSSGKARKKNIKIGIIRETDAEVLSGLSEGEKVVTLGWYNLTDGASVSVVEK